MSGCEGGTSAQPEISAAITDTIRCIEVAQISGSAAVIHSDGATEKLSVGSKLVESDNIVTSNDCVLTLTLDGNKTITVDPSSSIFVHSLTADGSGTVLAIEDGGVASSVDGLEEDDVYEVCTKDATMAIRGTDVFVGYNETDGTTILLLTGSAIVLDYSSDNVYGVPTGQISTIKSGMPPVYSLVKDSNISSDAVSAMKKRVEDENPDFEKDFISEIGEDNTVKTDYEFSVAESVLPDPQSAAEAETTAAATTTTTAAEKHYRVTFGYYQNGAFKTISRATVKRGGSAAAPVAPDISGYAFKEWNGNYSHVTRNETVLAQYVKKAVITFNDVMISEDGASYNLASSGIVRTEEFVPGESISFTHYHNFGGIEYAFTYTVNPSSNTTCTAAASSQPSDTAPTLFSQISCTVTGYDPAVVSDITA